MLLLFLLTPSLWCLSELWGGSVTTSDIYHFWPRLHHLLLRSLIIGPAPTSPPDFRCPASPSVAFRPGYAQDHPPTWASPVSIPAYQKTFARLSLTHHFQILTPPLLPRPHHDFRITVAATPTLPPKYLLTWISAVFTQPPVTITDLETSSLPHIPSILNIPLR